MPILSLGSVTYCGLVAKIMSRDNVSLNGGIMSLAEFIKLAKKRVILVIDNTLTTNSILEDYKQYAVPKSKPSSYTQWRLLEHFALLCCVLANKLVPPSTNSTFLDGARKIITELEEKLAVNQKTASRPISDVLQEYAVRAGAFYEACMLEVELAEQAVLMKKRMEMKHRVEE